MTEVEDLSSWTKIIVRDPLPLDVAGALMQLIGSAWPDARISTTEPAALAMLVPTAKPKRVAAKKAKQIVADAVDASDGSDGAALNGFRDGNMSMVMPETLQREVTSLVHALMNAHPDAVNFLTWGATYPGGEDGPECTYEMTVRRNGGESPADKMGRALAALNDDNPVLARDILSNNEAKDRAGHNA